MEYQFDVEYHATRMHAEQARERVYLEKLRPFMLLRPKVQADGNKWMALYGENIMTGVCGFGDTPHEASLDFDIAWLNAKAGVTQ